MKLEKESEPSVEPAKRSLTIEDEIANLRAQLPPIDYEAAETGTFEKFDTLASDGEAVECTCTFREVITYEDDGETAKPVAAIDAVVTNGCEKADDSEEDETDDFCAVDDEDDDVVLVESLPPPPSRGAVKSIFDPEYDANENLIDEMMTRRKPREVSSKVIEVKIDKGAVKPNRIEPVMASEPPEPVERVPIINYVCEEDPLCPARKHFQRDEVTSADVERLHENFVNGVNGFWNGIPEEKPTHDYSKDMESIDYAKHRLWKRVVPRYDFLTCDKIPKTFDDDSPFSMPPPPPSELSDSEAKPLNGIRKTSDIEFREWHELMNVRSYNDDVLTILPYVIID